MLRYCRCGQKLAVVKQKKIYLRNSVSWLTIIQSKMFMSVINIKLKRRNKTLENLKKKRYELPHGICFLGC